MNAALAPNGILVLASCGYYDEDPPPDGSKPYRQRIGIDQSRGRGLSETWLQNLATMAAKIGRPVFADAYRFRSLGKQCARRFVPEVEREPIMGVSLKPAPTGPPPVAPTPMGPSRSLLASASTLRGSSFSRGTDRACEDCRLRRRTFVPGPTANRSEAERRGRQMLRTASANVARSVLSVALLAVPVIFGVACYLLSCQFDAHVTADRTPGRAWEGIFIMTRRSLQTASCLPYRRSAVRSRSGTLPRARRYL